MEDKVKIVYHAAQKVFHLYNGDISYLMMVLPDGELGQLYFGQRIHDKEDFSYLLELVPRPMSSCVFPEAKTFSLEQIKLELPVYGSSDYRTPAVDILQPDGSRVLDFQYTGYQIQAGKPVLAGLPATYTEDPGEAATLLVQLCDQKAGVQAEIAYTIFAEGALLARSVRYSNTGKDTLRLQRAMSFCLDLPDADYEWLQLSGAWARERHVRVRPLEMGIVSIGSRRGHSSHEHNPFVVLKRPSATEQQGEVLGLSLVYSGNFQMQAEVDAHHTTRLLAGIHPEDFCWVLEPGECFQTPEAVLAYSTTGLNGMSQLFHHLYQKRLARGYWRDRVRPILINNWEATYFDFTEEKLLQIAKKAKECGVELFVLDDGWFGARCSDHAGLGDWTPNRTRLPEGIAGLAERMEGLGMKFGLWFEPEMVNMDSDLYRAHPDWILATPGRRKSHGRFQYVLDFSRPEVVEAVYAQMAHILGCAKISYVKWDMNRSITECYSAALPPERQGEVFHRYILGVYALYEKLTAQFPEVLFESCASGGGRFDPGMLYYAPQAWTSDDSDAIERLKIQYGTSFCYPVSSMGSHVSVIPNHQVSRNTPLHTRANAAYFGTFGYELDLNKLSAEEIGEVKLQIAFMKEHRALLQFGTFYRLRSPFEGNETVWMVVSQDKRQAIVGWYRTLNQVNGDFTRVRLMGLQPAFLYQNSLGKTAYGDELMHLGLITTDVTAGEVPAGQKPCTDFESRIYVLSAVDHPGEEGR